MSGRAAVIVALGAAALAGCTGNSADRAPTTSTTGPPTSSLLTPDSAPTPTTAADYGQPTGGPLAFAGPPQGQQCTASQLVFSSGGLVSEATQQHSLGLMLTNESLSGICHVEGYPRIALTDARGDLPLTYRTGGDQMVTSNAPEVVNIPAGGSAYVLVNKNGCVGSDIRKATAVRVVPPGASQSLVFSIGPYPIMASCGPNDPGSTVTISPVEPTAQATLSH